LPFSVAKKNIQKKNHFYLHNKFIKNIYLPHFTLLRNTVKDDDYDDNSLKEESVSKALFS